MAGQPRANTVPVFPLNTVLFPFMPLPLHIFEGRYKRMVADIRGGDGTFCVSLIREGVEVGGPAQPHEVGCLARIAQLTELENGRYQLVTAGTERVRILSLDNASRPYLVGVVSAWPDEPPSDSPVLVREAADLFQKYAGLVLQLLGEAHREVPLPSDPAQLSYVIATALQVAASKRQELLEIAGSDGRLQVEIDILRTEVPLMRAIVNNPRAPNLYGGKFSAN